MLMVANPGKGVVWEQKTISRAVKPRNSPMRQDLSHLSREGEDHGLDRKKEDRVRSIGSVECRPAGPAGPDSRGLERRHPAAGSVRSGQEDRTRSIPPRLHPRRVVRTG